jgi:hypothetical protein
MRSLIILEYALKLTDPVTRNPEAMLPVSKSPINLPLPQISHLFLFLVALGIAAALTFLQNRQIANFRPAPDFSESATVSYSADSAPQSGAFSNY